MSDVERVTVQRRDGSRMEYGLGGLRIEEKPNVQYAQMPGGQARPYASGPPTLTITGQPLTYKAIAGDGTVTHDSEQERIKREGAQKKRLWRTAHLSPTAASPDCRCGTCRGACGSKPGWFLPGQAEKVAEHLGTDLPTLFREKLAVDYFEGRPNTFLLSPAVVGNAPGEEFPYNPKGRCVFFEKGMCSIHAVKPFECRAYTHTDAREEVGVRHESVAKAWKKHQQQVRDLLGREPAAEEGGFLNAMSLLGGW